MYLGERVGIMRDDGMIETAPGQKRKLLKPHDCAPVIGCVMKAGSAFHRRFLRRKSRSGAPTWANSRDPGPDETSRNLLIPGYYANLERAS